MLRVGRVDGRRASLLHLQEREGGEAGVEVMKEEEEEEEQRLILQNHQHAKEVSLVAL